MLEYFNNTKQPVIYVNKNLIIVDKNKTARESIPQMRKGMNIGRYMEPGEADRIKLSIGNYNAAVVSVNTRSVYSRSLVCPAANAHPDDLPAHESAAYMLFGDFMNLCVGEASSVLESAVDLINHRKTQSGAEGIVMFEAAAEMRPATFSPSAVSRALSFSHTSYLRFYPKLAEFLRRYHIENGENHGRYCDFTAAARNIVGAAARFGAAFGYNIGFYSGGQPFLHSFGISEFYSLILMLISNAAKNTADGIIAVEQKTDPSCHSSEIVIYYKQAEEFKYDILSPAGGDTGQGVCGLHNIDAYILRYTAKCNGFTLFSTETFDGRTAVTLSTETSQPTLPLRTGSFAAMEPLDDSDAITTLVEELFKGL